MSTAIVEAPDPLPSSLTYDPYWLDNLVMPPPYEDFVITPPFSNHSFTLQRGVIDPHGVWRPLLAPKGYKVLDCYKRHIACVGARFSTKTNALENRVARHLWEVDGAVAALVARTAKINKSGVWRDLVRRIIPGWCNAGFGMKIVKGPKTDAVTKMEYVVIRNMHGGESEVQLHSLDHDLDVEEKYKSTNFSLVWLIESDTFLQKIVYQILEDQLRAPGVSADNFHFLFDANPPEDGEDHWLHDLLIKAKNPESELYDPQHDRKFGVFHFELRDNIFRHETQNVDFIEKYKHDKLKTRRFVLGEWVKDTTAGCFDDVFFPNIHIVGKTDGDRKEWKVITPPKGQEMLLTGTDVGDLHHATSFLIPRLNNTNEIAYDIFDEVVYVDKTISLAEFAKRVWERVLFWNQWMADTYGTKVAPRWAHWADSQVFQYRASSDRSDNRIFYEASDGGLNMMQAPVGQKARGAVMARVALARRLFHSRRFFISANCLWNIRWARFLKPDRTKRSLKQGQPEKHPFDATTYAIDGYAPYETRTQERPETASNVIQLSI